MVVTARDGSRPVTVELRSQRATGDMCARWSPGQSPESRFDGGAGYGFDTAVEIASVATGERREAARSESLMGFCWRPDGSGLICRFLCEDAGSVPRYMTCGRSAATSAGNRQRRSETVVRQTPTHMQSAVSLRAVPGVNPISQGSGSQIAGRRHGRGDSRDTPDG